jgi:signal transduction histidine kinase
MNFKKLTDNTDLWVDQNKMARVVINLLSNAVKYTPKGGIINTVISSDENTVKFSVTNTGPGIPAGQLDKIFNKYERLAAARSDIDGIGLGLSIVKDIVEMHQGHVTVKSEPNKETEFSVVLPRDLRTARGLKNLK